MIPVRLKAGAFNFGQKTKSRRVHAPPLASGVALPKDPKVGYYANFQWIPHPDSGKSGTDSYIRISFWLKPESSPPPALVKALSAGVTLEALLAEVHELVVDNATLMYAGCKLDFAANGIRLPSIAALPIECDGGLLQLSGSQFRVSDVKDIGLQYVGWSNVPFSDRVEVEVQYLDNASAFSPKEPWNDIRKKSRAYLDKL